MKQKKLHRAWLIFICMMLIQGGSTGLLTNCIGVLFADIQSSMSFNAGSLSVYHMIRGLVSAAAVGYTSKLFFTKNSKVVMGICSLMAVLSYGAMAFFTELWQWYIAAAFMGIGSSVMMVCIPVVLNNWFADKNGLIIGITMASSGVVGAVSSPLLSQLITRAGWRTAALTMSGIGFVMMVLPAFLLLVEKPEDVGLLPWGYGREKKAASVRTVVSQPPQKIFFIVVGALVGINAIVQFNNQLPTFAVSVGYTLQIGAMLTSFCMIGNLVGKMILGALTDRFGIYFSMRVFYVLLGLSMLCFLLGASQPLFMYAGAVLFGSVYALGVTAPSLLFLDLYGSDVYRSKLSSMQAIGGLISAALSVGFPYIYDLTGSFAPVFIYGLVMLAAAFAIMTWLARYSASRANG